MSTQAVKIVITGVLLLHGLGHAGALGALIYIDRVQGTGRSAGDWRPARLWLLPSLGARAAGTVAAAFWILSAIGFVAAALAVNVAVLITQLWLRWPPTM